MTSQAMWIIGYGSLIFKPPPLFSFRVSGTLEGFVRRFWQSSADHRGTADSPGRVVTLISLEDLKQQAVFHDDLAMYELNAKHSETDLITESSECLPVRTSVQRVSDLAAHDLKVWGVAYYIAPENVAEVKEYLDVREQDGYTMHEVQFWAQSGRTGDSAEGGTGGTSQSVDATLISDIVLGPEYKPVHLEVFRDLPKTEGGLYIIQSMIYIGTINNASFVGPEHISKTAQVIKKSIGASGHNYEYLWKLVQAIRELANHRSRDHYLEDLLALCDSK